MRDQALVAQLLDKWQADYVIPISGDSMEPTFHSDDRVFVAKDDALEEGDIGIFIVNGDAYLGCFINPNLFGKFGFKEISGAG